MTSSNEKPTPFEPPPSDNKNAPDSLSPEAAAGKKLANVTSDLLRSAAREMGLAPPKQDQQPGSRPETPSGAHMTPAEMRRALWTTPRPQSQGPGMKDLVREAAANLRLSAEAQKAGKQEKKPVPDTRPSSPNAAPVRNDKADYSTPMPASAGPAASDAEADGPAQRCQYVAPQVRPILNSGAHMTKPHTPPPPAASPTPSEQPDSSAPCSKSKPEQPTNNSQPPAIDKSAKVNPLPAQPPSPQTSASEVAAGKAPEPPIVAKPPLLKPDDEDIEHDLRAHPHKRRQPAVALCIISSCLLIAFVLFDCILPPSRDSSAGLLLKLLPFALGSISALLAMFFRPRSCRVFAAILLFLFVFHAANRKPILSFMKRVGIIKCHADHYVLTQPSGTTRAGENSR